MKLKKLIFYFFVNRNWKKLTDSRKRAKILADNRKSHHPIETLFSRSKNHLRRSRCIQNGNVTREKLPHGIMGRVHNPPLLWPYYAALTQKTTALETSQPWWHCKEIDCYIFHLYQECLSASKPLCQQTIAPSKSIPFLPVLPIYIWWPGRHSIWSCILLPMCARGSQQGIDLTVYG